ncbi:MAG: nucleotide sugar dehydrogenase [Phycisphaerales bacterium]|nr:MAG: nucleotide sugar dehydrogenase [Phycisphaerales bacterium]
MTLSDKQLASRIDKRTAVIGVVGMGYVGLPLVRTFCGAGFRCLGYDIDDRKVTQLNAGRSYIKHIPSATISGLIKDKRFRASSRSSDLRSCDAILVCVPTPLTRMREPDMTFVEATCDMLAGVLKRGQLIVLESTTYPGTTKEVVKPILERGGLKADRDFYLAFSPEREDPGREDFTTETIPKVVGGIGPRSRQLASALYEAAISRVVSVSSCEVAEASKILENVYRCVNIAMINELKVLFDRMGINIWEVIEAASTKPFGFQPFYPGPGLGGHCIPIDPFYLTWKAREYDSPTRFIELAGEINTSMPAYVVAKVADGLNRFRKAINGSRILVLGLAYKRDIDDLRESPSIELIELLRKHGATVDYNDPHIPATHKQREHNLRMKSRPLTAATLKTYDCVLISTDHSSYDYPWIVKHARLVVDTRNATAGCRTGRSKIVRA